VQKCRSAEGAEGAEGAEPAEEKQVEVDTVDLSGSSDGLTVNFGGAKDADGYVAATHGSNVDLLTNIENLVGSDHDDSLTGDENDQTIIGGDGNDS
jgi:hypothetical protein